jgi:hypothetical protein
MQQRTTQAVMNAIRFLKLARQDFTVKQSTYTTIIEANGKKQKFIQQKRDNSSFIGFNKIKKDIDQFNFIEQIQDEPILRNPSIYYANRPYIEPVSYPTVINIDLTNAYPTTLKQTGGISTKTFNYLNHQKKTDKLASLGMLAARHDKFIYEKGILKNVESSEPSKYAAAFFYCVKWVDFMMLEAEKIAGIDFLYFWVDGIYLNPMTPPPVIDEILNLFFEFGYKAKIEIVEDFHLKRRDNLLEINFLKTTFEKNKKRKTFQVPDRTIIENQNKIISKYLNNSKK